MFKRSYFDEDPGSNSAWGYLNATVMEPLLVFMDCDMVLFSSFSYVYDCFKPCERMRKHAFAGRNAQQRG